jgi:hypothetical protein
VGAAGTGVPGYSLVDLPATGVAGLLARAAAVDEENMVDLDASPWSKRADTHMAEA